MSFNNIYLFIIIIFFCPLIGKIIVNALEFYSLSKEYQNGSPLLNSLIRLTPKEFQIWCGEYLAYLGYSNIIFSDISDSTSSIICTLDNSSYYVCCKKNPKDILVDEVDLESLLGLLISKSLYKGILITTSPLSSKASSFLENIPSPYYIEVISLNAIIEKDLGNYPLQLNNLK